MQTRGVGDLGLGLIADATHRQDVSASFDFEEISSLRNCRLPVILIGRDVTMNPV